MSVTLHHVDRPPLEIAPWLLHCFDTVVPGFHHSQHASFDRIFLNDLTIDEVDSK